MKNKKLRNIDFLIISFILACYIENKGYFILDGQTYLEVLFALIAIELLAYFFNNPFNNVTKRGYLVELEKTILFDSVIFLLFIAYLFFVKSNNIYTKALLIINYLIYIYIYMYGIYQEYCRRSALVK